MEGLKMWQSDAESAVRTLFRRCVQCEKGTPSCPECPSGQQCSLRAETCTECAYTFCIDSASASASLNAPARRKPNVGAIAGGVIGGLIVIAVATWLVWRCCIKSRRQRYEEELRQQQAEEDEKWAGEVEASEQARRSTLAPVATMPRDEHTSMHTVASSTASSVFTRASNVIQIAYIPGVTNRSPPSTPGLLVPPVPPLPVASPNSTTSTVTSPNGARPDQHFFMPEIRDSTYSATTDGTTQRESMAPSLGRSSVATTIYRNNAIVNPVPAQTVIRGKAAVVSVKSSNQSSPNESRTTTPPMPVIDYDRYGRARGMSSSQASGGGGDEDPNVPRVPASPAFSVGSTFLSGAANTAKVATPRPISVRKPSSKSARSGDGLPTLTPSASSASKHSRARRPDLARGAGMDVDDEEDDEPGARARKSMFGAQQQRDSTRTVIEDTTPVLPSAAHRSPFSDTQAISSPNTTIISSGPVSPTSPDSAVSSGIPSLPYHHHHHSGSQSGSLSAVIEEAARRAARQPTHGGLGSSNNRDSSPFSDENAVRTP